MKKEKKSAPEDKKVENSTNRNKKAKQAKPAPEQEPDHSSQNGKGLDLKAIKAFTKEIKNQSKLLKEMQKELKAMSARVGAK